MDTTLSRIIQIYNNRKPKKLEVKNRKVLYQQIFNLIKAAILNNDIPEGSLLPSTRKLSEGLKMSRSTIIKTYELLLFEGYVAANPGSGHRVIKIGSEQIQHIQILTDKSMYPELSEVGKSFQKTVTLQNSTDDASIAFRPGLPPLDIFPVNQWKNLTNNYWRYIKSSALTYSSSSGTGQLKKTLADYLNFSRKIKCDPRQIIIVSGSLQSLYLIGSVVLNPGEKVIVENITFPNVNSIFRGLRAEIQTAGIDRFGLMTGSLNEQRYLNAKLLHVVPSCHYPTGVKMSLNRRQEILQWANQNKTIIIENDYEHEVNNSNHFIPSLFSLDTNQRTVFLGTFNRLLHPSIRVGYMVAPYYLLDTLEALLKHSHRFVPSSIQVVLSQFIEKNYLFNHIKNVIEIAEERKMLFDKAFRNSFDESFELADFKTLSLHTLAYPKNKLRDSDLVTYFSKNNIITHTLSKCNVDETSAHGLIFGYSPVRPPVIRQKIQQMEKLFKTFNLTHE